MVFFIIGESFSGELIIEEKARTLAWFPLLMVAVLYWNAEFFPIFS